MSDFKEGKHARNKDGQFTSGGGESGGKARSLSSKRDAVADAMQAIANGKQEATMPNLRNDLEQYGGTNDVTIMKGNSKKGLLHIAERHGQQSVSGVLEAVIDGEITRFSRGNKTIALQKDGYEAILSLEEHGKKKTWLLTGYELFKKGASDERGKFCTRHAPTQSKPTSSRPELGADASLLQSIAIIMKNATPVLALDSSSQRRIDENGFMHVSRSHISKETVNPYYGREIPDWQNMGLDPERVYQGYRAGEELAQAAATFNGLPLLQGHHVEHAESPQKEFRVGSLGTDAEYTAPYLSNSLIITDAEAIRAIEMGQSMELSAAYMYDADFTAGTFDGQPYDFVMRNIRGNHVALVPEGRAGADVVVADAQINPKPQGFIMGMKQKLARIRKRIIMALDADPSIEKTEVDLAKALLEVNATEAEKEGVNKEDIGLDADKDAKIKAILTLLPDLSPEKSKELSDALQELAYDSDTATDEDPKAAEDADDPALDEEAAVKKAMDACGLDAEDPDAQKAFAEGVKYGEGNAKADPKKPAADESEGATAAMDSRFRHRMAMDAASIQHSATQAAKQHFKAVHAAARDVRPLVGDIIDPMAFDSAEDIYGKTLEIKGFTKSTYPRSAWRGMCDLLRSQQAGAVTPISMAYDSKADGPCKHLSNIRVED